MKFLIVAGEESGEIYGATLMREIKKINPDASFEGIGGDRMAGEGLKIIQHSSEMASIGVVQMLKKLRFFLGVLNDIRDRVKRGDYDAVILVDYPDFNLRVARAGFEAKLPVFYYVCPQFWAWRQYRVRAVRQWIKIMLVMFPFEEKFYRDRNANAKFVGHPLLDEIDVPSDREALRSALSPEGTKTLIGLLPGSRKGEVNDILPTLLETADIIHAQMPDTGFVMPVVSHVPMERVLAQIKGRDYVKAVEGGSKDVMAASDLLITKSGTSTLEAAIIGVPMVIVYRSSFFNYWLAKPLVQVEFAGLPNLIAGKEIAKEFFQYDFLPDRVAREALSLLNDKGRLEKARSDLAEVRGKLGEKGAASRAAKIIVNGTSVKTETGEAPSR